MNKFTKLATAAVLFASAFGAHAQVIDFNGLAGADMAGGSASSVNGYTYFYPGVSSHVAGYTFASADEQRYMGSYYATVWSTGLVGHAVDNGTDYLTTRKPVEISRTGGGSFNLNSLDLSNFYDDPYPWVQYHISPQASFVITGKLAAGGTVSTIVTLDDLSNIETRGTAAAFNHFSFTGFTNLTSFEIHRLDTGGFPEEAGIALDNLNVSAVPEPSSWAMMGLGLLGLAAYAKRRKA
ncbi:PEP-CTERM sorting domain-containing protein [Duganella sp. HH101]|nr:PEP-CTERM sorting domain-containing protein [Duganella sp. HH101]